MRTWLRTFPSSNGKGLATIIFDYISQDEWDKQVKSYIPEELHTQSRTEPRKKSGLFLPDPSLSASNKDDENQSTHTIELKDRATIIFGADEDTLFLKLDLRALIPKPELDDYPSVKDLILFRHYTAGIGGSWRGEASQIETYKETPSSFLIKLSNGTGVIIERGVKEENKSIHRLMLIPKPVPEKCLLAPTVLILEPDDEIHFSEDQRYLFYLSQQKGRVSILDTLQCREEKSREIPNANTNGILQQVAMSSDYTIVLYAHRNNNSACIDSFNKSKEFTCLKRTAISRIAFSPSCESLFGICAVPTANQYELQTIDLATLTPRSLGLEPFLIPGNLDHRYLTAHSYLTCIGDSVIYIQPDGTVRRWIVPGY